MKKKAQAQIFVFLMVGIMIFIMAVVFTKPISDQVTATMNVTGLNCTSPATTTYTKATCSIVDFGFFYFISSVIAVGLALIGGKRNITGVMTSIFIFIVIVALITPLKNLIILARDSSHLNCSATTIAVGAKLTCIFVDLWLFYVVAITIASAVTFIFIKRVMPGK